VFAASNLAQNDDKSGEKHWGSEEIRRTWGTTKRHRGFQEDGLKGEKKAGD
jgi:hypothetical protein